VSATSIDGGPTAPGPRKLLGPYQALLGNRNMALLFSGQIVSALGDWLYVTTLVVLIYTLTGSAVLAAAVSFARLLPYVVFLPIAGVLADRFDRRKLMIVADAGRALCMVALFTAITYGVVWLAFPLVFVATCLGSLFRPALAATVPELAGGSDKLPQANALVSQIDSMALVLGPALAGMLILADHARAAFVINAMTYAVSAATLALLRLAPRVPEADAENKRWLDEVLVGARFLFGTRSGALRSVTLSTAGMTAFNGASWTLIAALATTTWHFGAQGSGFLIALYGAGGLIGGFMAHAVTRALRPSIVFGWSLSLGCLAIVAFGLSPAGALPFALLAGFGAADLINQVVGNTIIQTATPEALLGRVFGAFEAILVSATVLGALASGPLIETIGPRATTVTLALVALAIQVATAPRLSALDTQYRPANAALAATN
jgi:MFS family permease